MQSFLERFLPALAACAVAVVIEGSAAGSPAWAVQVCGDDIGGVRVACACGDVALSDVTLAPGDPIVSERCMHDGLVVRADAAAESVVIDLAGQTIVGSGHGYGILVERGGSDGAVIVGGSNGRMGQIVGFGDGIHAPNSRSLSRLEAVAVVASTDDGIRLNSKGAVLVDVRTTKNGRNGLSIRGIGGRVFNLHSADNGGAGARISSRGTIVEGVVRGNAKHGVVVGGSRNDVRGLAAHDNSGIGIAVHGGRQQLEGADAEFNAKGDVRGLKRIRK